MQAKGNIPVKAIRAKIGLLIFIAVKIVKKQIMAYPITGA
jgi:hypothetical protein